jgi:hypothetical protein
MYDPWIWTRVTIGDGCWEWSGPITKKGYGNYKVDGIQQAHRVAYTMLVGPIPEGLALDHLCLNHLCVRPSHLEPVTFAENTRRARALYDEADHPLCQYGHEFTVENTYRRPDGRGRMCRTCIRERSASQRVTVEG